MARSPAFQFEREREGGGRVLWGLGGYQLGGWLPMGDEIEVNVRWEGNCSCTQREILLWPTSSSYGSLNPAGSNTNNFGPEKYLGRQPWASNSTGLKILSHKGLINAWVMSWSIL